MTSARIAYLFAALLGTGGYAWGEFNGWEPGHYEKAHIEPSVRQSPGGWRSFSFWHQGIHGGK